MHLVDEEMIPDELYQSMSMVEKEAGPDYSSGVKSSKSKTLAKTSKSKSKKNTLSPTTKAPTTTSPTTKAPTTASPTTSPTTSSTCKDQGESCFESSECCKWYSCVDLDADSIWVIELKNFVRVLIY